MKTKKSLFFIVLLALFATISFTSCNNGDDPISEANVEFALDQTSLTNLIYGEPVIISGTVSSESAISSLTFTGVKKDGENYTAVGDVQIFKTTAAATLPFKMEFFPDNKTMTHVEIKASVGNASKSTYVSVSGVQGEAKGSVFLNSQIILRADTMVWNHENHPDEYPNPNTGAKSATPSYFSINGVTIEGEKKHVLSIDEVRSVEGEGVSFTFINVLQNTANNAYIGGQRGYMFANLSNLSGGTIGRQCDMYEIDGKAINKDKIDKTQFKIIAGSWIGDGWNEARYKLVDSIFVALGDEAATEAAKLRAYYLLGKIQLELDNATLGESDNPTNLSPLAFARRRTDAGQTATNPMVENFRAGDYIVLRTEYEPAQGENLAKYRYGIMQIVQMEDDGKYFYESENGTKIDREQAHALFLKPLILNIKVQSAL